MGLRRQFADFLQQHSRCFSEARTNSVPPVSSAIARECNCQSSESLKPFHSLSLVPCESANVSSVSRFSVSGVCDLPREIADDRRVVEVAPLRDAGHEQMVFDEDPQRVRRRPSSRSRLAARMAISALTSAWSPFLWRSGLADVVQQQRQVKQAGPFQPLEQRRVMFIRRVLGLPDLVELLEADQRVFVGGVLMVKLVLHQAGELAEFGNVFAEQIHLVHGAQNRRHLAAPFEDGQERFAHVLVVQKIAVHQRKLVADELREVGMQSQAAAAARAEKRASAGAADRGKCGWTRRESRRPRT